MPRNAEYRSNGGRSLSFAGTVRTVAAEVLITKVLLKHGWNYISLSPNAAHEALKDLVRAREAAKRDQLRARHRPGKFLLRQGRPTAERMKAWTQRHLDWIRREVKFAQFAQRATLEDYLEEVDHLGQRIL
jgi:uncharacterized protein YegL